MERSTKDPPLAVAILILLFGPILWAGHLFLVYAFQSATCAITGVTATMSRAAVAAPVILLTLAVAAFLALALWRFRSFAWLLPDETHNFRNQRFSTQVGRLLILLSLVGVVWTGAAALFLDPCGQIR
jgi:hypothetical protein